MEASEKNDEYNDLRGKILEFRAENVKKIKCITIVANGETIKIGGRNKQGKTSYLDAIEWCCRGPKSYDSVPVRTGEDKAEMILRTVDFTAYRTIHADGRSELLLVGTDGQEKKSPQKILDSFFSALSFDPLEFLRMETKKQVEVIKRLVADFDFVGNAKARDILYKERTHQGRILDELRARQKASPYDPNMPEVEVSPAQIADEIAKIEATNAQKTKLESNLNAAAKAIAESEAIIAEQQARIAKARAYIDTNTPLLAQFPDLGLASFQAKLDEVTAYNQKIRGNLANRNLLAELQDKEAEVQNLSRRIAELDIAKVNAIAAANLPVSGLDFTEEGLLYNGLPIEQEAMSGQIEISVAIGIALNPEMKVMLVREAEFLDDENLALLETLAKNYGIQLWLERVGDGPECSVIIEDGEIKENRMTQGEENAPRKQRKSKQSTEQPKLAGTVATPDVPDFA